MPQGVRGNSVRISQEARCLAFTTAAQISAGVKAKQALPLVGPDLKVIMRVLTTSIRNATSALECLALVKDIALSKVTFRTGARGTDLQNLKGAQVLELPNNRGLVLNFHFTKTCCTR